MVPWLQKSFSIPSNRQTSICFAKYLTPDKHRSDSYVDLGLKPQRFKKPRSRKQFPSFPLSLNRHACEYANQTISQKSQFLIADFSSLEKHGRKVSVCFKAVTIIIHTSSALFTKIWSICCSNCTTCARVTELFLSN